MSNFTKLMPQVPSYAARIEVDMKVDKANRIRLMAAVSEAIETTLPELRYGTVVLVTE